MTLDGGRGASLPQQVIHPPAIIGGDVQLEQVSDGEAADITRPDPLAGIGDAAYYGGILPSLVLEDDVLIEVMMPLLENDREHFPELARKAVSRL